MFAVQPGGLHSADKELRTVGVWSSIGHGHNTGASVLQGKVLILELVAVDRLAASAIVVGKVSALKLKRWKKIVLANGAIFLITQSYHEIWNHAMKGGALITESLLASAKSADVLSGLGNNIVTKLKNLKKNN